MIQVYRQHQGSKRNNLVPKLYNYNIYNYICKTVNEASLII